MTEPTPPIFLTTKELAELLRVKERTVYDLAAEGQIPQRRITGKLLFPRAAVLRWIDGEREGQKAPRPAILSGSHDPLLDWAVRASDCGLATLWNGSQSGLGKFAAREAGLSGLHIPDADGWNVGSVTTLAPEDAVLVGFATRSRGILYREEVGPIENVIGLRGRSVVQRQPGAGAAVLLDKLLKKNGLRLTDLADAPVARTEGEAAAAVASGGAEAALGLASVAREYRLPFTPLMTEHYDLLIDRRSYFTPEVQTLLSFTKSSAFADRAASLAGYDVSALGVVRWLSD